MIILLVDATIRGFAVGIAETASKKILWKSLIEQAQGSSQFISSELHRGFTELKMDISAIESIAVAVGPGSFTGIRIGLSLSLGIGAGLPKAKWLGYSSIVEASASRRNPIILKSTQEFGYLAWPDQTKAVSLHVKDFEKMGLKKAEVFDSWSELEESSQACAFSHLNFQQLIESSWNHLIDSWSTRKLASDAPQPLYLRPSSVEERQV